jgi:antitoxin VapB
MALHIRDDRALKLAKKLAAHRGTTMTQAVVEALEGALTREERPLAERLAEIARDIKRRGDPKRGRAVTKQEIDELWGHE